MPKIKVEKGGVYANAHDVFAREVIDIRGDGNVIYNDYALSDGAPFGRNCRCSLETFTRWVVRPLAPDEIATLRRDEGEARERAMTRVLLLDALEAAPDELILREFYRRGLDKGSDRGSPREKLSRDC
jgi:hypothetical protein